MIVVAGMPRSCTTLLARAVAHMPPGNVWIGSDDVHKTHYPYQKGWHGLFVIGCPYHSVESSVKNRWTRKHLNNCMSEYSIDDDPYTKDVMGLGRMVESWIGNGFVLRDYEIWTRQEEIQEFLGFEIHLPERKEYKTKVDIDKFGFVEEYDYVEQMYLLPQGDTASAQPEEKRGLDTSWNG